MDNLYGALGYAGLLVQQSALQGPQWHRVLVPIHVTKEVVSRAQPDMVAHHRVGILGYDVELLCQVGDEHMHHLSAEAR